MLMEVKNNLKYIKKAVICNLKSVLEYKTSFIIQTIFMFINNFFFLIFWKVVFRVSNNQTNGIEMKDILYLWSIPVIAYGLSHFIFGGIENISKNLISGGMDSYMTQPKNIFINIATSKCDFSACGDLLYGLLIGIIASRNLIDFIKILLYSVIGSIIMIAVMTIIRSLAAFIGDIDELAERYEHALLINFSTYPEEIFGKIVKGVLYTIVPVGYIVYIPIKLLGSFNIKYFLLLIIITILLIVTAIIVFNKALKNYESGNSMTLKG